MLLSKLSVEYEFFWESREFLLVERFFLAGVVPTKDPQVRNRVSIKRKITLTLYFTPRNIGIQQLQITRHKYVCMFYSGFCDKK